jgi:sugar phosphate isomerase/epimerase
MKLGSTTLPLAGWFADPGQPEAARNQRLSAIRELIEVYSLTAIELTLDLGVLYPQVFDEGFFEQVAQLQTELGFTCTVHLPFLWIDPASANEWIRAASADCLRRAISLTETLPVETYVLHLWGLTARQVAAELKHPVQRQAILGALSAQAGRTLDQVCQLVDPTRVCVENLEDPLFDLALPLVEYFSTSICLDVGHLAWSSTDPLDFLASYGSQIREVHLHDAVGPGVGEPGRYRDHMALGRGALDHAAFLHALEISGFDGPIILELNTAQDLEHSLERIRRY